MMNKRAVSVYLSIILGLLLLITGWYTASFLTFGPASESTSESTAKPTAEPQPFDGVRAYTDVQTQVAMGPRMPGSAGHTQIKEWMRKELEQTGWTVEVHKSERLGYPIYNLIAKRSEEMPQVILGAHYDTRLAADNDPDPAKQTLPVPGANDGASGVAILLELARTLPQEIPPTWLVFFDAEDNGRIENYDWILGSRAFVEEVPVQPQAVVIIDMVGDADLNIYFEKNSDPALRAEIWATAASLGYENTFIAEEKYSMLDDHTPFVERAIPAVNLIDFDYPYWHTTSDTPDKVSAKSLQAVGETLWHWLQEKYRN